MRIKCSALTKKMLGDCKVKATDTIWLCFTASRQRQRLKRAEQILNAEIEVSIADTPRKQIKISSDEIGLNLHKFHIELMCREVHISVSQIGILKSFQKWREQHDIWEDDFPLDTSIQHYKRWRKKEVLAKENKKNMSKLHRPRKKIEPQNGEDMTSQPPPSVASLKDEVEAFLLQNDAFFKSKRGKTIEYLKKQCAAYLYKKKYNLTNQQIAQILAYKDHRMVRYAVSKFEGFLAVTAKFPKIVC